MRVRFIKTSHQNYTLEVVRSDNSTESRNLEAKSLLKHDLMHFVLESLAGLQKSFFGSIARGDSLNPDKTAITKANPEILQTEIVVSILQSIDKQPQRDNAYYLQTLKDRFTNTSSNIPTYLSLDFIARVRKEYSLQLKLWERFPTGSDQMLEFKWADKIH